MTALCWISDSVEPTHRCANVNYTQNCLHSMSKIEWTLSVRSAFHLRNLVDAIWTFRFEQIHMATENVFQLFQFLQWASTNLGLLLNFLSVSSFLWREFVFFEKKIQCLPKVIHAILLVFHFVIQFV